MSNSEIEIFEAKEWIAAGNGSPRLRKIHELGLLETSLVVYRDERLQPDRPGWRHDATVTTPIHAPEEWLLDRLVRERAKHGEQIQLRYMKRPGYLGPVLADTWNGRQIVLRLKGTFISRGGVNGGFNRK